MKKSVFLLVLIGFSLQICAWGPTGHRVVGLIAEQHLSKKALKNIRKILGAQTLAEVSVHMDFIKSDPTFRHMSPWHYATIPEGTNYTDSDTPAEGDVIITIERLLEELKAKAFTDVDEAFALKCLVHLVGDIHQPLHVGNGEDRGGNDISLDYFWEKSNLHRVWDSGIINQQGYSYTEYVAWINHPADDQLKLWKSGNVREWAMESAKLRTQCYETMPENKRLTYRYNFDNIELLNQRLLQAGVRLAYVLEQIYGKRAK
ncbi:MAG: S1/P1 nuclease [Bacteroidota bacterium]